VEHDANGPDECAKANTASVLHARSTEGHLDQTGHTFHTFALPGIRPTGGCLSVYVLSFVLTENYSFPASFQAAVLCPGTSQVLFCTSPDLATRGERLLLDLLYKEHQGASVITLTSRSISPTVLGTSTSPPICTLTPLQTPPSVSRHLNRKMALLATQSTAAASVASSRQATACPARPRVVITKRVPAAAAAAACSTSGSSRGAVVVTRASRADSAADMARWEQQVRDGSVGNVSVKQAGEQNSLTRNSGKFPR
jgi:hypothetical protein